MGLPINPRPTKKKQVSVRLSYAAIDMLHYLKGVTGLTQEAIIERLVADATAEVKSGKGTKAYTTGPAKR